VTARHVPISSGLPADFKPLIEAWKKKGGMILPTA
jgi:hypothetical protein